MATEVKRRRGTTTQHDSFTGAEGEITVDLTKDTLVVHDGSTQAGFPLLREDFSNAPAEIDVQNSTIEATEFIGDLRGAVRFRAKAVNTNIAKGDAVYISGIDGNTPTVGLADADNASKMPAFGLAAADINENATGEIITFGTLSGVDTSSFSVGDILYIDTSPSIGSTLTATAPAGESAQIQNIGKVQRSHASTGSIKVGGAGRSNATPNLNQDKIFLGDSNNRAVSTALSSINLSSFNDDVVSGSYLPLTGGTITGDLIVKSTDAGAAADPNVTFFRDSASPADNDVLGDLLFSGRNDAATQVTYGRIASQIADASSTTHDGKLRFQVASDAALVTPLTIEGTASTFTTSVTATSFVKTDNSGGFLKADGTEDTNTYLTSETSHADVLVDGDFTSNGLMKRTGSGTYTTITDSSTNWDAAYTYSQVGHLPLTGGTISSNLIISGNLTVSGTTTTVNTETIKLADNIIMLNSNFEGETPSESSGIEIERGPSNTNKQFLWNETDDRWQTDDALYVSGALTATGNVTGSNLNISNWDTAYGWGDHSTEGYLTSYTETDTLASVTGRGASTSTSTTFSGGLVASGGISGLTLSNGISGSNFNISGVNQLSINDPGEGIVFGGGTSGNITLAVVDDSNDNILRISGTGAELQVGTNRVLTTADEGSGNGLDADTLDGQHASAFLTSSSFTVADDDTNTTTISNNGSLTISAGTGIDVAVTTNTVTITSTVTDTDTNTFVNAASFNTGDGVLTLTRNDTNTVTVDLDSRYLELSGGILTGDTKLRGGDLFLDATAVNGTGNRRIRFTEGSSTSAGFQGGYIYYDGDANKLHLGMHDATDSDTANDLDVITILRSNQNVGIGTDSPSAVGSRTTLNISGSEGSAIRLSDDTGNAFLDYTDGSGVRLSVNAAEPLTLRTSSTDRVTIDSSGNVGIGTTSPSGKLDVNNSTNGDLIILRSTVAPTSTPTSIINSQYYYTGTTFTGGSQIRFVKDNATAGNYGHHLEFYTRENGSSVAERMRIDSSGNVGIGISPDVKFQIHKSTIGEYFRGGSGNTRQLKFTSFDTASEHAGHDINASSGNGVLTFSTGGNERLRIDSSGNVLVGKTTTSNADAGIELNSTGQLVGVFASGTHVLGRNTDDGAILTFAKDNSTVGVIGTGGGSLDVYSSGASSVGLRFAQAVIPMLNGAVNDGDVDLGTSTRHFKDLYLGGDANIGTDLDVGGTATISQNVNGAYRALLLNNERTALDVLYHTEMNFQFAGTDGARIRASMSEDYTETATQSSDLLFYTRYNGTLSERLRINDDGNVGIGTTSPSRALHVNSGATNEVARFESTDTEVTLEFKDTTGTSKIKSRADFRFETGATPTEAMRIDSSGNVGIGTTSPVANAKLTNMGNISLGIAGNGSNTSGRFISIEGNTDSAGEGSGRIFFSEHNSTTASMSKYGMSIGYRGGSTSIVGSDGNTWSGLGNIANGEWGMWGHNGNATGALIMHGDRAATFVNMSTRLGINGDPNSSYKLDVNGAGRFYRDLVVGGVTTNSSTTNYESVLRVKGKNNYSDGTTWYGDYGQILLDTNSNMTASSRKFLITNALDNNKFAIVRSVDAGTDPVVHSTSASISSGTADFVIDYLGNVGIGTENPDGLLNLAHQTSTSSLSDDASEYALTFNFEGATNDYGRHIAIKDANGDAVSAIGGFDEGTGGATGLYFATGNTTSIAERLRIDSSGDVGIGTTSPNYKLDVAGDMGIDGYIYHNGDDSRIGFEGNDAIRMYTANSVRLQIQSNGNVGIGTGNPNAKFDVVGDINSSNNIVSNSTYTLFTARSTRTVDDYGGLNKQYVRLNLVTPGSSTTGESSAHGFGDLRFQLANTSGTTSLADIMTLRYNGNVGIGTTTPSANLQVVREITTTGIEYPLIVSGQDVGNSIDQGTSSGIGLKFEIAGNDTAGDSLVGASIVAMRESTSDTNSSTGLAFLVSQNDTTLDEAVRINENGNVGIGTDSPSNTLVLRRASSGQTEHGLRLEYVEDAAPTTTTSSVLVGDYGLKFKNHNSGRNFLFETGTVLIGKSVDGLATVGTSLFASGVTYHTTNGVITQYLNRTTSDGPILEFRKDNSTVGRIGTIAGDLAIGDADVAIRFDTGTGLVPWNISTNLSTDNAIDIGASSARFKDLYLGGNANIDGDIDVGGQLTISDSVASGVPLLVLDNDSNGNGATIEFNDNSSDGQKGLLRYNHADSLSQGGGCSFHFTGEPDTVLVVGNDSNSGRFVASGNSASEVAYGFRGDVNTGMYSDTADYVKLATGGVDRLTIASSGSIGINYNTPSSQYGVHQFFNSTNPDTDNRFAYFIDGSFSGADNTTGTREQGGIYLDIDSSADGDASNEHRLRGIWCDVRHSGFSDIVHSGYFYAESNNTTEATSQLYGIEAIATHDGGGSGGVNTLAGSASRAYADDAGSLNYVAGAINQVLVFNARGANNITTANPTWSELELSPDFSGTITNHYGVRSALDNNSTAGATITNSYLFFGDVQGTDPATNKYGIHIGSSDRKNYFAGNVGIGTTSPSAKLDVNGDAEFADTVTISDNVAGTFQALVLNNSRSSQDEVDNVSKLSFQHNSVNAGEIRSVTTEDFTTSANQSATLEFYAINNGTLAKSFEIRPDGDLSFSDTNNRIEMSRGGYITFYEDGNSLHAIGSRDDSGNEADDLRINSYGAVYINLDSNNNNSSAADFVIGRHGGTSTISDNVFKVNGENKRVSAYGGVLFGTDTAEANTLNDYEEGSWTPVYASSSATVTNVTYTSVTAGRYIKVGNVVHLWGRIETSGLTWSSSSGAVYVGGIPFDVTDILSGPSFYAGTIGYSTAFGGEEPKMLAIHGTERIYLYYHSSTTSNISNLSPLDTSSSSDSNDLIFQVTYRTG